MNLKRSRAEGYGLATLGNAGLCSLSLPQMAVPNEGVEMDFRCFLPLNTLRLPAC